MTPRERKAPGGISATAALPDAASVPQLPAARNGAAANGSRMPTWAEWFQRASAVQRDEILALARAQGLIYSHQIPAPANGVCHNSPQEFALNPTLVHLLAGKTEDLVPVAFGPVAYLDQQLDAGQREAVARALYSPDLFLLSAAAGAGTLRVLAEILQQTAARGERVLLLANQGATLDAVLLHLAKCPSVHFVRFQGPGESPLSPEMLPFTLASRRRAFKEQALDGAAKARAEAETQVVRRRTEESCWKALPTLARDIANARLRLEECHIRSSHLAEDVQHEAGFANVAGAFATALADVVRLKAERQQALKDAIPELIRQQQAVQAESTHTRNAVRSLRPLAAAKQSGRWWTLNWWRATFRGQVLATMAELENRLSTAEATLHSLAERQQENTDKECQLQLWFEAEQASLSKMEVERRRQDIQKQENDIHRELEQLTCAWQAHVDLLEPSELRPKEMSEDALQSALATWEKQRQLDLEACQFACRWADYVAEAVNQLATRLPDWSDILAGTMTAFHTDRAFADCAAGSFDKIVFLNAEQFSEADIMHAARRHARLILVGQMHNHEKNKPVACSNISTHTASSGSSSSTFFHRIWQVLHCDSRRTYDAWAWEKGRLCCTLRPVSHQDCGHIETEHVANFPEIELRILARPKAAPLLAQVIFPSVMNILQAKEFIYRELEEVAVHAQEGGAWLADEPDRFLFHLSSFSLADTTSLNLESGLREWVALATGKTCCLEFTKAAGWSRRQVDQWLSRHLQVRDLGRTMAL